MDQDRRDANAWAKEWYIRQKNRRLLMVLGAILLVAAIGYAVHFTIVHVERTTFRSTEDMRKAMQGRFAMERDYEDIIIEGDEVTLTYLAYTHYNREYAERYGYDYDEQDSVYEDHVEKWDYRNGVIRTQWMGDLIVDKNGKAIGIVSAVVPGIKEPANMDAKLSAEEAEAIVKEKFKDKGIEVVTGGSEEVLLPSSYNSELMYNAWAVYSGNNRCAALE